MVVVLQPISTNPDRLAGTNRSISAARLEPWLGLMRDRFLRRGIASNVDSWNHGGSDWIQLCSKISLRINARGGVDRIGHGFLVGYDLVSHRLDLSHHRCDVGSR